MKITVLASGSGGNATYIETDQLKILIDTGISLKQIKTRMNQVGIDFSGLDLIFITHEHGDHIKHINVLHNNTNAQIYMNKETLDAIPPYMKNNLNEDRITLLDDRQKYTIQDLEFIPISTSHDAANSTGFIFTHNHKKMSYFTDTGYFPEQAIPDIKGSHIFIIEANYDPELLIESNRPRFLKERIIGIKGHLSNFESIYLLKQAITEETQHIIFAHRSRECNTIDHIHSSIDEIYPDLKEECQITFANQDEPTKIIEV